ncbi:hypothetical protein [Jiella pacifica]|uniref:Capsular polysaccharide transport system permease protein n=1 Tax=Jiella pacifica TaxID=2696469 RepID=A0A6N9SZP0_9HYPH|nr:hypothetical protein [Jiella pacifica]NDW03812.1 hypothetical protein [Jiella pacifica]
MSSFLTRKGKSRKPASAETTAKSRARELPKPSPRSAKAPREPASDPLGKSGRSLSTTVRTAPQGRPSDDRNGPLARVGKALNAPLVSVKNVFDKIEALEFQALHRRRTPGDGPAGDGRRRDPVLKNGREPSVGAPRRDPRQDPQLADAPTLGPADRLPEVAAPVARTAPGDYVSPRPLADPSKRSPATEHHALEPGTVGTVRRLDEPIAKTGGGRKPPWLFLAFVVLPTLVTGIYLGFFAADRYTSEASYVIRKGGSPLTAGAALPGLGRSDDSSEAIVVFFQSRDATDHLAEDVDLKAKLMHPSADVMSGYPGIFYDETKEGLYEAMRDAIEVRIDADTGISRLEVTAFTPQDAQELATALLKEAEILINRLNDRATNDAIAFAKNIVAEDEDRVRDIQNRMTDFRNTEKILDPSVQSTSQIELMTALTQQMTGIDTEIAQLKASAPKNPRLRSLGEQRQALQDQIQQIRLGLAGADSSLASKMSSYERLNLERDLAIQALTHAYATFEEARQDAFANRLYLQTIAAPNLPDRPSFPTPLFWTAVVAAVGFALYRIARTVTKETMEHAA